MTCQKVVCSIFACSLIATLVACSKPDPAPTATVDAFPSTYKPASSRPTLIKNARVLTGTGEKLEHASLLMQDGKIVAIGNAIDAPSDAVVIDAAGKTVTPGIIDAHSHLGVYPSPGVDSASDGNEAVAPDTAHVWAEHSVWPQDPQFPLALQGGVTSMLILPGSANLFGGRGVVLKNVPARAVQEMKFPGAPYSLKMACGENPKRVYGEEGGPATRMGNVAGYRKSWIEATKYRDDWKKYNEALVAAEGNADAVDEKPDRDLRLETLAGVLSGEILVQNHCYRADEMLVMFDIAKEFNYRIQTFHHAVEAYKVADKLAEHETCAAVWADWWGFKQEAFDMVFENAALVDQASVTVQREGKEQVLKGCAVIHSDSALGIQRLNQEAAKAMAAARRAGIAISDEQAMRWLTLNPAKAIGVAAQTGSLEQGKNADVVIWDRNPFSVYARAEKVFVDGALLYDRHDPAQQPRTDFELGVNTGSGTAATSSTHAGAQP